jgi:hypothetical protein
MNQDTDDRRSWRRLFVDVNARRAGVLHELQLPLPFTQQMLYELDVLSVYCAMALKLGAGVLGQGASSGGVLVA